MEKEKIGEIIKTDEDVFIKWSMHSGKRERERERYRPPRALSAGTHCENITTLLHFELQRRREDDAETRPRSASPRARC